MVSDEFELRRDPVAVRVMVRFSKDLEIPVRIGVVGAYPHRAFSGFYLQWIYVPPG
ncbi:MAG: hypothetical protein AAF449_01645 [Myxococcota bacterium]